MRGREVFDNIPEEACRELEAIVGPENLTTDPAICEGYTGRGFDRQVYWWLGVSHPPGAVILPKSVDDVVRIAGIAAMRQWPEGRKACSVNPAVTSAMPFRFIRHLASSVALFS